MRRTETHAQTAPEENHARATAQRERTAKIEATENRPQRRYDSMAEGLIVIR